MRTAEQMVMGLILEGSGVNVLLWSDIDDLLRALIVIYAAAPRTIAPVLATGDDDSTNQLRQHLDTRQELRTSAEEELEQNPTNSTDAPLLLVFVQQASSKTVGPWLNGSRRSLAHPPGSILAIRTGDFEAFQRAASDLASFVGPRVYDASSMISLFSETVHKQLKTQLPEDVQRILKVLPGKLPSETEIRRWIEENKPLSV